MLFSFNVANLIAQSTPPRLRVARVKALFTVLFSPLPILWAAFVNFRMDKAYLMAHNSQVCHLRALLNDKFDYTQRRITIGDGSRYDRDYIFSEPEQQPQYLGTMYIDLNAEFADSGFDFIVKLNGVVLSNDEDIQIRNYINIFKLAGKRYKIIN
jgi:hypothetical protein